jgi:tripartite-type tricarboxylate transporter receptor subunit TctC
MQSSIGRCAATARIGRRAAIGLGAALALPGLARAQTVQRNARLVMGFPPGGSSDVVARLYAERLRGTYAPNVIVDSRPGAAGRIAVEHVRDAEKDGTVFLQTPASMLTVQPHVFPREVRYDALTDLIPVSTVCTFPFALSVPMNHPARTLAEWAAWARTQPGGEAPWASPAAGSVPHFIGIMLGRKLDLKLTHVPYRGGAPAVQDVIAGRLPLFIGVLSEVLPHHGTGLRIIAVTSQQRFGKLPDVPTLAEIGYPDESAEEWFGVALPAGTPTPVVQGLHAAIRTAAARPDLIEALGRLEFAAVVSDSPQAFADRIRRERDLWGRVVRESGFQPEG